MDYRHRHHRRPNITNNLRKISDLLKRSRSPPAKSSLISAPSSPRSKAESIQDSDPISTPTRTPQMLQEDAINDVDMERDHDFFNIGNLILRINPCNLPLILSGPDKLLNDAFRVSEAQAEINSSNFFSLITELSSYKFIAVLSKPVPGIIPHYLNKVRRIKSQERLDDFLISLLYCSRFECLLWRDGFIYPLEIVSTLEALAVISEIKEKRMEDCICISY